VRRLAVAGAVVLLVASGDASSQEPASGNRRLFPPEDLGILESPDRDEWQQPDRIMDALQIADGSRVADIGAGGGWFTVRLARRVGPNGVVFAQDVQREMIESIRRRAADQGLTNVETVLGETDNPRLPSGLDAVLMVDTYPQVSDPIRILGFVRAALKPGGLLGIVDFTKDGAGGPGPPLAERLEPEKVRRDAESAGFTFRAHHTFLRYEYLLVFER
jgi:predicted methyltransferase